MSQTSQEISKNEILNSKKSQGDFETNWFVFYTYPRAEKIVYRELIKRDYDVFLPLTKQMRQWKNRQKKWIECVLFPSYIFINTRYSELFNIIQIPKIVSYVHCSGKPSTIKFTEMDCIKKMLQLDQEVTIENEFNKGERVKIIYGPLAGHEGLLIKQKGRTRFGIQLTGINHTVFIDICINVLQKVC